MDESKNFKLVKELPKGIGKGAFISSGTAGVANTLFPNLIPKTVGLYTTLAAGKVAIGKLIMAASIPAVAVSGGSIILWTGLAGAVIGGGVVLCKRISTGVKSAKKKIANKLMS